MKDNFPGKQKEGKKGTLNRFNNKKTIGTFLSLKSTKSTSIAQRFVREYIKKKLLFPSHPHTSPKIDNLEMKNDLENCSSFIFFLFLSIFLFAFPDFSTFSFIPSHYPSQSQSLRTDFFFSMRRKIFLPSLRANRNFVRI